MHRIGRDDRLADWSGGIHSAALCRRGRHPLHRQRRDQKGTRPIVISRYRRRERERELANAGYSATRIAARNILLFDDFITRGATLSAVASVIRRTNKTHVRIFGVALGKNERVAYLKEHGREASNDHVRLEWLKKWPLISQP